MDYQEFRTEYEAQHPASVPQPETFMGEYPKWVTPVVAAMFITAALFSGLHTIPIAYSAIDAKHVADWLRQLGGVSAFLFLDAGVLLSAYLLVKKFNFIILTILGITILVAMGANLYSVAQAFNSETSDVFTKIITVFFGLVAPLMAALSGGIYVWLHQSEQTADMESKAAFKEQQKAWDKIVEKEWKKYQRTGGQGNNRPQSSASSGNSPPTDGQPDNGGQGGGQSTGQGYTKRTDARDIVKAYLENNPDGINGNVRQIARFLNVGKTTVSDVQRELKERLEVSTNGHSRHV